MDVMSAGQVAEALALALTDLKKLWQCGLLDRETLGRTTLYSRDQVEHLAQRPAVQLPPPEPALVIRLGPPSDDDGRPIGWDARRSSEANRHAVHAWWRVRWPDQYIGHPLVAVVASFVVGVWQVGPKIQRNGSGHVAFELLDPTPDQFARYYGSSSTSTIGNRLRLPPGPVAYPIGPTSESKTTKRI